MDNYSRNIVSFLMNCSLEIQIELIRLIQRLFVCSSQQTGYFVQMMSDMGLEEVMVELSQTACEELVLDCMHLAVKMEEKTGGRCGKDYAERMEQLSNSIIFDKMGYL